MGSAKNFNTLIYYLTAHSSWENEFLSTSDTLRNQLSSLLQIYGTDNALLLGSNFSPEASFASCSFKSEAMGWGQLHDRGLKSLITARFNGWHNPLLHPAGCWGEEDNTGQNTVALHRLWYDAIIYCGGCQATVTQCIWVMCLMRGACWETESATASLYLVVVKIIGPLAQLNTQKYRKHPPKIPDKLLSVAGN